MTDDASIPRDHAFMPKRNHGFLSIIGLPPLAAGARGNDQRVNEKIETGLALQALALTGGLGLTASSAATKMLTHYRRKVRANRRRLAKR
jgi:hypothetical protein